LQKRPDISGRFAFQPSSFVLGPVMSQEFATADLVMSATAPHAEALRRSAQSQRRLDSTHAWG
jgi:hypothetical protein